MSDRFNHEDGVKAQDIDFRGGKLIKKGITDKRDKSLKKAAGAATRGGQSAVSGYLKKKEDVLEELDKAFE